MSDLIKSSFKAIGTGLSYLLKGYVLREKKGARFSSRSELKNVFKSSNKGVLIDGKSKRLSEKDSFEHIAVIAKPGAGKTSSYIMPNILDRANRGGSMLALDPSGELFEKTSGHLKKKGYKIKVLCPEEPFKSCQFNPFDGLGPADLVEIEQICSSIVLSKYGNDKEGVWNDGAISLIEVFAKCLAYGDAAQLKTAKCLSSQLNLVNINYLLQMFGTDGSALDDWVAQNSVNPLDPNDRSIVNAWLGITKSNKNMLSSYTTIAKTALKQLNNRDIQSLLCANDLDFEAFRREKTILYIVIPAHQQAYYQFIIDILYTRFFNVMMKRRPEKGDLDVYCFLDEFGSSYIKDFQAIINNIRKYRVSLSIVLQTVSQLTDKYGKASESIKGGLGSYIVFSGADQNTAKQISDSIGKMQIIERDRYTDVTKKYHEQNLLNPDQIRTLDDGEIVFLSKNRYPFILNACPYFENSAFRAQSALEPFALMAENKLISNQLDI